MHIGNYKCIYNLLRRPEEKKSLIRLMCRCEDNIKVDFRKTGCVYLDSFLRTAVSELCPSTGILNTRKHDVSQTGCVSTPG
jgi:hypothetical protein